MKSLLSGILLLLCSGFVQGQTGQVWEMNFPGIGIHSSPRVTDLNQDGVKDIIIGCGKKEFEKTPTGVLAVDGKTGKVIWRVPARDQIFGSAALMDIDKDGVEDVIIGGRAAELKAINGRTGKVLWEFFPEGNKVKPRTKGFYNFYNPQVIPDQNNDGVEDILVTNGGDILVPPYDPNRPPGHIIVINGANGRIIAKAQVPDGKETYMSIVMAKLHPEDDDYTIIYGTGGETIGGNLYRTSLKDVLKEDISGSVLLASSKDKGYIAPPALCDLNEDGILDVIVNAVEGKIVAFDGLTNTVLWQVPFENTEAYASLAIGKFNDDQVPDIFTTFTEGVWPQLDKSMQIMINGKSGKIEFLDSLGILQTSSPVVADFNNDGYDDGLVVINFVTVEKLIFESYNTMLVVYDFRNDSSYQLTDYVPGINLSSTPWVGDLDNDGKLDVVYCYLTDTKKETSMNGFKMVRLSLDTEVKGEIKWGSYMGTGYNGIYKNK
jgi:outer membrane protein assembly factor BamB